MCSCLLHVATGLVFILLLPALALLMPAPRVEPQKVEIKEASLVLKLPPLGARTMGSGPKAPAGKKAKGTASASQPTGIKTGFTFLGPQPIVSDLPHHDNLIQTVRQPDLPSPPKLKMPLASPNILQMASAAPPVLAPQPRVVEVKARANSGEHIPLQPRRPEVTPPAKLNLPLAGDAASKAVGALAAANAVAPKLAEPPPPPPPARVSGQGADQRNLLVVSAVPSEGPPPQIPAGELAGAFSVSPNPSSGTEAGTVTRDTAPGTGLRGTGMNSSGSGGGTQPGGTPGAGPGDSGRGNPGAGDLGKGTGSEPGGAGRGPGEGPGTGTGSGPAGRGGGNVGAPGGSGGPGSGPFPGVSIGGAEPAANSSHAAPRLAAPHGTYALTIVATGAAGGGFGDFGVFKNEVVYTVYLDMADPGHARPKWTLQYATIGASADSAPVAPFPIVKDYPRLPPEATARNVGRKLVVTGVITKEGKFDSLRVIQSPNPLLIRPLLDTLAKWTFQAAELKGEPLAVKFVLGLTISTDLIEDK